MFVKMFRTGKVPVSPDGTPELYAFMEAAAQSAKNVGEEISLKDVFRAARAGCCAPARLLHRTHLRSCSAFC